MINWKNQEFIVSLPPLRIEKFLGAEYVNISTEDRRGLIYNIDMDEEQWNLLSHAVGLIREHKEVPKRYIG